MNSNTKVKNLRPVDIYFNEYADNLKTTTQKFINGIGFSLMVFSALGIAWAIPFPYLKFLGQYNGFFNWASFLIAISIYYYYKLSPVLSYLILIVFFAFSYGVMELDKWHKAGGPPLWLICLITFFIAIAGLLSNLKIEGKKLTLINHLQFLIIGPVWLLHFALKRFSIKY